MPMKPVMSWETPVPTYACRKGFGALSVVAGARNHLQANRSLVFQFEITA